MDNDSRTQVFKGCINLLRATYTSGSNDLAIIITLDPVAALLEQRKFKGYPQLIMYVCPPPDALLNCDTSIMRFDYPHESRRWSEAFSWIQPTPQARVALLIEEKQVCP